MSSTHDQKAGVGMEGRQDIAQIQKDMEARRQAMLKAMDDSKAKFKSLLRTNQPGQ
jgi:hypothetical protein